MNNHDSNHLLDSFQGCVFLTLGVMFFFDSALLALGDVLFLTGLTMTIGEFKIEDSIVRINECRPKTINLFITFQVFREQ